MSEFKPPKFANEAEEARWWYENRELVSGEFQKAAKAGPLRGGGVRRLLAERGIPMPEPKPTPTTTIRLDPGDIVEARKQAEKRGLRYQTYLKMIIHEALQEAKAGRKSAA
jgi:hypothetical protein